MEVRRSWEGEEVTEKDRGKHRCDGQKSDVMTEWELSSVQQSECNLEQSDMRIRSSRP